MTRPLHTIRDLLRAMPGALADAMNGWVMRVHAPLFMDSSDPDVPCRHCKQTWPCEAWWSAAERRTEHVTRPEEPR